MLPVILLSLTLMISLASCSPLDQPSATGDSLAASPALQPYPLPQEISQTGEAQLYPPPQAASPYPEPEPQTLPTTTAPPATATLALELPPVTTVFTTYEPITVTLPGGQLIQTKRYFCPQADAAQQAPVYDVQIVKEFPHDPAAYTQGLLFLDDGTLLEGTGLYGASSLREVELDTGRALRSLALPEIYFGEGVTVFADKIYQLTWREQTGFVYDPVTFEQVSQFSYPTEGWGLTHDSANLVMSDGTQWLYFLNPETLQLTGSLEVTSEFGPLAKINELEMIDGEIWANIFQSTCIVRINPISGQVTGWLDLSGLLDPGEFPGSDVPNGIAYDTENGRLFVTGKLWPKLFQIELKPR